MKDLPPLLVTAAVAAIASMALHILAFASVVDAAKTCELTHSADTCHWTLNR